MTEPDRIIDGLEQRRQRSEAYRLVQLLDRDRALSKRLRKLVYRCPNKKRCTLIEIFVVPERGVLACERNKRVSDARIEQRLTHVRENDYGNPDLMTYDQWRAMDFELPFCGFLDPDQYPAQLAPKCTHIDDLDVTGDEILDDLNAGKKNVVLDHTRQGLSDHLVT